MRVGLGLSICAPKQGSAAAFDPATLSLTGWWRADFTAIPWTGTASAGSSGSKNLTNVGDAEPVTGNQQNGLDPANFTAASGQSVAYNAAISNLVSAGAGTVVALAYMPTAGADGGAFVNPAIVSDGANLTLSFSTNGVHAGIFDGAQKTRTVAASAAAYHAIFMKWDGASLYLAVDSGAYSSTAAGNISTMTGTLSVAKQPGIAFLSLRLLEFMTLQSALSDADRTSITEYFEDRYALTI